ncbi:phage protein [Lentisphaerota bacterium WC36G]|nr:DUF2597 family protein [Lentisphaerae bacterium WC36]
MSENNSTMRLNGLGFNLTLNTTDIKADKWSLSVSDDGSVATKDGLPDGWLKGAVAGSGEVTMDRTEFKKMSAEAKKAGSWQGMPTFNLISYAKVGNDECLIEAYGCKFKMDSVLDADKNSSDKTTFTLKYDVTSPDFVKIDGVPYAEFVEQ